MPKLGQYKDILKTVVFLYENEDDARAGVNIGGTGFLISIGSRRYPNEVRHTHVVTNWHVAVSGAPSCPVVRINTKSGKPKIIDYDPSQWFFVPGGPDVAVSPPFEWLNDEYDAVPFDGKSWLLTSEEEIKQDIGAADDIFMIGRFVDYSGEETNTPALRFGHISIFDAKIEQPTGYKGRSIVADMHSRTGFSGSPVIVYRTMGSAFIDPPPKKGMILTGGGHYISLLGILWGQFPEEWELKRSSASSGVLRNASIVTDGEYVKGLSGMSCIVPAAEIIKVMLRPGLEQMRSDFENGRIEAIRAASRAPRPEAATKKSDAHPASDANPNHREDFTRLLGAAARKPPQED
jgi:hypothetical protein